MVTPVPPSMVTSESTVSSLPASVIVLPPDGGRELDGVGPGVRLASAAPAPRAGQAIVRIVAQRVDGEGGGHRRAFLPRPQSDVVSNRAKVWQLNQ